LTLIREPADLADVLNEVSLVVVSNYHRELALHVIVSAVEANLVSGEAMGELFRAVLTGIPATEEAVFAALKEKHCLLFDKSSTPLPMQTITGFVRIPVFR
jgi:hypothetical protein